MPTYEYKCNSCNKIFDVFQSIKADPIKVCPECGGEVKRLIGAGSGPIFKGSGFYQTDYKNKTVQPKNNNEKTPPKKETESKPATENKSEKNN